MIILGKSPPVLNYFSNIVNLEFNILKFKVMVLRKWGGLRQNEIYMFNGSRLKVVNAFNYLGTVLIILGNS